MLIDGKEVYYAPKKAESIQNSINNIKEMPDASKQGVGRKEIKDIDGVFGQDNPGGGEFGLGGGALEGYGFNNNTFDSDDVEGQLQNRINYYSNFQEMSNCNFIHRGLQIIADDATRKNDEGNALSIYSDDDDIKGILEDLFNKRLGINKEIWSMVYETCKLGDNFYEIIPDSYDNPKRIARIRYLDPTRVNRIEKNGELVFYTYKSDTVKDIMSGMSRDKDRIKKEKEYMLYKLQPWQIVHFKINDKDFYPYGGSLLKSGLRSFKRLNMLEDAMVIYRLARVPERRVFRIGVGNLPTAEANRYLQRIKDNYRNSQILDENGNLNKNASALSLTQDIFVPVREGDEGTQITSLAPGQALNNIDDIKYFRDEILWTMNIPPEYLGFTSEGGGGGDGRGSLAMQDLKFSRFVERIQYYIEDGLSKIAAVELFFNKKKKEELKNFRIELTEPSNIAQVINIEYINQKVALIQSMQATNIFSNKYILKYVMNLSRKEIDNIVLNKQIEAQQAAGNGISSDGGMGMDMSDGMGAGPVDMSGGMGGSAYTSAMPPSGAAPEAQVPPAASVKTISDSDDIARIFGKDVLIENKKSLVDLVNAMEDYKKEKEKEDGADEEKIDEELENMDAPSLVEEIKEVMTGKKHLTENDSVMNLISSNELKGLNFSEEEFTVYSKPHKRSGPKVKGQSDLITEEITTSILGGGKKRRR